jgi:hypothetical protein
MTPAAGVATAVVADDTRSSSGSARLRSARRLLWRELAMKLSVFRNHLPFAVLLALPLAGACTATEDVVDDLAGESAADDGGGKADSPVLETFFEVRQDQRRCVAPLCGGWWVSRVNHAKTTCGDGVKRTECYVAELDPSAVGVTGRELEGLWDGLYNHTVVLRGEIQAASYGTYGNLGRFAASEAWQAGTDSSPDGVWVLVKPNGVRCVAAPCPDKSEQKLNSALSADISDLDFEPSGATEDQQSKAWDAMLGDGTIVVGERYYTQVDGRRAKSRTVTQFYTRLLPSPSQN